MFLSWWVWSLIASNLFGAWEWPSHMHVSWSYSTSRHTSLCDGFLWLSFAIARLSWLGNAMFLLALPCCSMLCSCMLCLVLLGRFIPLSCRPLIANSCCSFLFLTIWCNALVCYSSLFLAIPYHALAWMLLHCTLCYALLFLAIPCRALAWCSVLFSVVPRSSLSWYCMGFLTIPHSSARFYARFLMLFLLLPFYALLFIVILWHDCKWSSSLFPVIIAILCHTLACCSFDSSAFYAMLLLPTCCHSCYSFASLALPCHVFAWCSKNIVLG